MKAKTVFVCKECGTENPKWLGKCPGCGGWNTFVEEKIENTSEGAGMPGKTAFRRTAAVPKALSTVSTEKETRSSSGSAW